jgi:hypothetical protein
MHTLGLKAYKVGLFRSGIRNGMRQAGQSMISTRRSIRSSPTTVEASDVNSHQYMHLAILANQEDVKFNEEKTESAKGSMPRAWSPF